MSLQLDLNRRASFMIHGRVKWADRATTEVSMQPCEALTHTLFLCTAAGLVPQAAGGISSEQGSVPCGYTAHLHHGSRDAVALTALGV